MKKLLLLLSFIVVFTLSACGPGVEMPDPEFCGLTEMEENQTCFDDTVYNPHYEGLDFVIYKLDELPEEGTDDVVEFGVYDDAEYYFSSGTHLSYYVVEKEQEQKNLQEALEAEWFTLQDMVNDFTIEELYFHDACGLGLILNEEGICIDDPETEVFNNIEYNIIFDGDYTLYEKIQFTEQDGELFLLTSNSELSYYLGNSSIHDKYLVDGEYSIDEALAFRITTIDELLEFDSLNILVQDTVIDEVFRDKAIEVRDALRNPEPVMAIYNDLGSNTLLGRNYSLPIIEKISAVNPFQGDPEWEDTQERFYDMLVEAISNGYQEDTLENLKFYIENPDTYYLYGTEFTIRADLQEPNLYFRVVVYSDEAMTDFEKAYTGFAEMFEGNLLLNFSQEEGNPNGNYHITFVSYNSAKGSTTTHYYSDLDRYSSDSRVASTINSDLSVILQTQTKNGQITTYNYLLNYATETEVYLVVLITNDFLRTVNSINYVNHMLDNKENNSIRPYDAHFLGTMVNYSEYLIENPEYFNYFTFEEGKRIGLIPGSSDEYWGSSDTPWNINDITVEEYFYRIREVVMDQAIDYPENFTIKDEFRVVLNEQGQAYISDPENQRYFIYYKGTEGNYPIPNVEEDIITRAKQDFPVAQSLDLNQLILEAHNVNYIQMSMEEIEAYLTYDIFYIID